jgi:acyl-CoA synthetase (AMP-forming)/AMP-acid ligase II
VGQNRVTLIDGEICVSGPQVALGYMGRPAFGEVYHTGDLAQWAESGELLYRGRLDNMVKISGYRIEPGEVEAVLIKHPVIKAVKVIPAKEHLTAYCVLAGQTTPDIFKTYLAEKLPPYMIPRDFIILEKIPIDERTGKVNLAALR